MRFENRTEAGKLLAGKLHAYQGKADTLVLALPRGGLPVGIEIARILHLPMDILLVRKLGTPGHEELAMGAMAPGIIVWNETAETQRISEDARRAVVQAEEAELNRRNREYRGGRPLAEVKGKTIIVVDDGLATGATMRAATELLHRLEARCIVVAVPVAPPTVYDDIPAADEIFCLTMPMPFYSVSQAYAAFPQLSDDEVRDALDEAAALARHEAV